MAKDDSGNPLAPIFNQRAFLEAKLNGLREQAELEKHPPKFDGKPMTGSPPPMTDEEKQMLFDSVSGEAVKNHTSIGKRRAELQAQAAIHQALVAKRKAWLMCFSEPYKYNTLGWRLMQEKPAFKVAIRLLFVDLGTSFKRFFGRTLVLLGRR